MYQWYALYLILLNIAYFLTYFLSGRALSRDDCALKALESQLKETQKLADMYREQVIDLEDKLSRIREEGDVGKELFKVFSLLVYTWSRGALVIAFYLLNLLSVCLFDLMALFLEIITFFCSAI